MPPATVSASRRTLALRVYYLAAVGVAGVYQPFFPRWLEERGMLGARMGVIAAASPAMSVIAPAAIGVLADSLRLRGGLLQLACAGGMLTFAALAVAAEAGLRLSFGVLLLAATLFALFKSPMGFIADVVALEQAPAAGTTYGRLRLWGSLGFMGAVPVAARLVDPRYAPAFPWVMSGFLTTALIASLFLPRRAQLPPAPKRSRVWPLLAESGYRRFLISAYLGQYGHSAYDLCFSLRLFELGVPRSTFAVAWDLGTAAEVLMLAYSAPLFQRFAPRSLYAFALSSAALRWVALALVRSPGVILVLQPLHALSFGLAWVSALGYTSRRFPPHLLATAQGLFSTAIAAGAVCGMVTWGSVYHHAGGAMVFAGAACFSACACGVALGMERRSAAPLRAVRG
jgi:PPP family 3-phenylpropionic acid transporter